MIEQRQTRVSTWIVVALVLVLLWSPYSWLVFTDYGWSDYRWFWVLRWPVLPGLPVLLVARPLGIESTPMETLCMGIMTALMIATAVVLGRRSRAWLIGVCITLAGYGLWMAFASHAVFRA